MPCELPAEEHTILAALDELLRGAGVHPAIERIAARVEAKLAAEPGALLAWEPVPLETYSGELPAGILSSWVFVLRAGTTSGAERHPNSHQRMMAWRGAGDMQLWGDSVWQSNVLTPGADELEQRWVSIPVNVWHKPVMGKDTWVVVSFHTVPAHELIEETGGPEADRTRQRIYVPDPAAKSPGAR